MSSRGMAAAIGALTLSGAIGYVAMTLRSPDPPTFAPSSEEARPARGGLVGPLIHTVDAREQDRWRYFSFARGSVVEKPRAFEWDLAFRRFQIIVNGDGEVAGGGDFRGMGGAVDLGRVPFDSVLKVPESGYVGTRVVQGDSVAAPLETWYRYSFMSHLLSPSENVYAVRTADGRYAKLRFLGYYCPGAQPGCVTFEYVYQGGGGPEVHVPSQQPLPSMEETG